MSFVLLVDLRLRHLKHYPQIVYRRFAIGGHLFRSKLVTHIALVNDLLFFFSQVQIILLHYVLAADLRRHLPAMWMREQEALADKYVYFFDVAGKQEIGQLHDEMGYGS